MWIISLLSLIFCFKEIYIAILNIKRRYTLILGKFQYYIPNFGRDELAKGATVQFLHVLARRLSDVRLDPH